MELTIQTPSNAIHGTLVQADRPAPIALLFHGIFVDRSENGRFDRLASILAANKLSSLRVDLSGHGASEVPSRQAQVARMTTEILDVLHWARKAGDYEQVYVVASSFAGALFALGQNGVRPGALCPDRLVLLNPVLDFKNTFTQAEKPEMAEMFSEANQLQAFKTGWFRPTPNFEMSREFLLELDNLEVPAAYGHLQLPHLVLHGTSDELVSFERTKEISMANSKAHFLSVDGGVHAFTQSGHESIVWERVVEWMTR